MAEPVTAKPLEAVQLPPVPELALPEFVTVTGAPDMRLSPNDMRRLKAETGRSLGDLTGEDADEADRMQTMTWLKLRREGLDVAWSDLGDVAVEFDIGDDQAEDPTSGEPMTSSPGSVTSGE